MNIHNLERLATQLESRKQAGFDIRSYRHDSFQYYVSFKGLQELNKTICNTVSCALGGFVEIEPMVESDWDYVEDEWSYEKYSERVLDLGLETPEWRWCFDSRWNMVDNTPKGAAKRIRYMLAHGVPKGFDHWCIPTMVKLYT